MGSVSEQEFWGRLAHPTAARRGGIGAADQLVAHSGRPHGADFFLAEFADAGALHLFDAQRHAHQNVDDCRDLHRRIPTIQIVCRIGFRRCQWLARA